MPGRFPVGKPKLPSWALPLLALSLTLMVHGLWLVIPQPKLVHIKSSQKIRLYAYPNLDTQAWSPTLFSLPSPLGFSGAIRKSSTNIVPPLQSPVVLNKAYPLKMTDVFPDPGLQSPLNFSGELPITIYPSTPLQVAPIQKSQWRFRVLEGSESEFELSRLPGAPLNRKTMVITGSMSFDGNGQVQTLVLDNPTQAGDLRPQLLRSLRRIRQRTPQENSHIRFRFDYSPVEISR